MRKLEKLRETYRIDSAADQRRELIRTRLETLVEVHSDLGLEVPPLHVILRLDPFRAEIDMDEDAEEHDVRNIFRLFSAQMDALPTWRAAAEAKLSVRLRETLEIGEGVSDETVLKRADAVFTCEECSELFRAPEAIRHCCTDGDVDAMADKWPLDDADPLLLLSPIQPDSASRVKRLIKALGLAEDASLDAADGCFVVSPLFETGLVGQDHAELTRVFRSFHEVVRGPCSSRS